MVHEKETPARLDCAIRTTEKGDADDVRVLFDANVFRLIAVTQAVLPMRPRRRGRIGSISLAGGLVGMPGIGFYTARTFAVEGLSEALAKEVEPGPFRTDWVGRSLKTSKQAIADDADTAGALIQGDSGKQPSNPDRVAEAIIMAADSPAPPLHLVLGGHSSSANGRRAGYGQCGWPLGPAHLLGDGGGAQFGRQGHLSGSQADRARHPVGTRRVHPGRVGRYRRGRSDQRQAYDLVYDPAILSVGYSAAPGSGRSP